MVNAGASIEAVLTLNASGFNEGITQSVEALNKFITATDKLKTGDVSKGIGQLTEAFARFQDVLLRVDALNQSSINTFSRVSNAINKLANGLKILTSSEVDVVQGVNTMNSIFEAFQGALNGTTVKLDGVVASEKLLISANETLISSNQRLAQSEEQVGATTNQASTSEERLATTTNQATSSVQRQASAYTSASANANRMTSSVNGLSKAMSSLKMVGSLVASMLVWNFASSLVTATRNTVNAKSEMEGYFQMLHFGQSDIAEFNKALDETVTRFQRVNKYSIGETIASIGVEFDLTTEEMKKAMNVTSMITSEYLRAGRNAEEASLAVKDVLQGQFQRLSRETGVKGEQLKEAGWSGDVNDVMGLMEALEKVAMDRNWDVFAEKANSINDIVTILQNRFGEWSADMVYAVQPAIVGSFNAIMSVGEMFGGVMTNAWNWLTSDGWTQSIVQIGLLGSAFLGASQMLLMYRANVGLVEASQMSLKQSILSVILGLKGQEVAEIGLRNSILAKILGVNAETVAEKGVSLAIKEKLVSLREEDIQQKLTTASEKLSTMATTESTLQTQLNTLQTDLNIASKKGLITAEQEKTMQQELGAIAQQIETVATEEQTVANTGLIASLYALGTGEALASEGAGVLATSWGVLNGVFELSPLGWVATAILAVASAIFVLTGGLDECWGQMQRAKEAIEDTTSALEPYENYVQSVNDELNRAKQEYGDNSLVVEELSKKYELAEDSLELYKKQLEEASESQKKLEEAISQTNIELEIMTKQALLDAGYNPSQVNEIMEHLTDTGVLIDRNTVAMQRLRYQLDDYDARSDTFVQNLHDAKLGYDEVEEATTNYTRTFNDMIDASYKMNTADNWWDYITNSLRYNIDKVSLDWQEFWADFWAKAEGDFWNALSNTFDFDLNEFIRNLFKNFGGGGVEGDVLTFLWDAIFGARLGIGNSLSEWMSEALSSIDLASIIDTIKEWISNIDIWGTIWESLFSSDNQANMQQGFNESLSNFEWSEALGNLFSGDKTIDVGTIRDWAKSCIGDPLVEYISNIDILGAINNLLNSLFGADSNANDKGNHLGKTFGDGLLKAIGNIPVLGDVLKMLGVIPQANSDANAKGKGLGDSVDKGYEKGIDPMDIATTNEMNNIKNAIFGAYGSIGKVAFGLGGLIVSQFQNGMDMHSPSIISRVLLPKEFGEYIPNAIMSNSDKAFVSAQSYGQSITDGISSVNNNTIGLGGMVDEYQSDAQVITTSSEMMGSSTTTAFNDMQLAVNTSTSQMQGNVVSTYNTMQSKQQTSLETMKNKNTTAYKDMYTKSNQSLIQMRDSTSNVTEQMTNAWSHMKDQIIKSADKLKVDSTNHFNQLSQTIGTFYKKIQNPRLWGAGAGSPTTSNKPRNRTVGRAFASSVRGAGYSPKNHGSQVMTLRELSRLMGGSSIFDGLDMSKRVDASSFLALFDGGFGWNTWSNTHHKYIKDRADTWDIQAPMIMNRIKGGKGYKVNRFSKGTPKFTFDDFLGTAEALFSAIPYAFYYNSEKYGSWVSALEHGETNCSDGADALLALASVFGFSGTKEHMTLSNGTGHFYTVINGKVMDTTSFQNRGTWGRLSGAGAGSTSNHTINVNIDMSNSNIYGVDELDNRIEEATDKAMEKHFNDPYTIGLV